MDRSKELIKQVMKVHKKNQKEKPEQDGFNATLEAITKMIQDGQLDIEMQEFNKIACDIQHHEKNNYSIVSIIFLSVGILAAIITMFLGFKFAIEGSIAFGSIMLILCTVRLIFSIKG